MRQPLAVGGCLNSPLPLAGCVSTVPSPSQGVSQQFPPPRRGRVRVGVETVHLIDSTVITPIPPFPLPEGVAKGSRRGSIAAQARAGLRQNNGLPASPLTPTPLPAGARGLCEIPFKGEGARRRASPRPRWERENWSAPPARLPRRPWGGRQGKVGRNTHARPIRVVPRDPPPNRDAPGPDPGTRGRKGVNRLFSRIRGRCDRAEWQEAGYWRPKRGPPRHGSRSVPRDEPMAGVR